MPGRAGSRASLSRVADGANGVSVGFEIALCVRRRPRAFAKHVVRKAFLSPVRPLDRRFDRFAERRNGRPSAASPGARRSAAPASRYDGRDRRQARAVPSRRRCAPKAPARKRRPERAARRSTPRDGRNRPQRAYRRGVDRPSRRQERATTPRRAPSPRGPLATTGRIREGNLRRRQADHVWRECRARASAQFLLSPATSRRPDANSRKASAKLSSGGA